MRAYFLALLVMLAINGACDRSDRGTAERDTLAVVTSRDTVARGAVDTTGKATEVVDSAPTKSSADPDVKGVEYWRDLDPKRTPARDADHGFLRTMADHNEGIVQMVAFAKDRATGTTTIADVQRITDTHARLKTELIDLVRSKYQDVFIPVLVPGSKQRMDSLDLTKPEGFNREFYQRVIEHNRLWIGRVDELSPRLKDAAVKAYATTLRAELQGEVDTFTRRLTGA